MARAIYAVPYTPPGAPASFWPGMRFEWVGWDGSLWDIGERSSGVYLRGARGMFNPPRALSHTESASRAGRRHTGSRALARDVHWDLSVYSEAGSQAWIDYDGAFARTLDPDRPGRWRVTQPNGRVRELGCRFIDDDDPLIITDPSRMGFQRYGLDLIADDNPWWVGQPITQVFRPTTPVEFIDGGGGPPFHISEGSLAANAVISNPGTEPARLVWWVGNTPNATVGVGDRLIDVPFEVADDRLLVVDTDQYELSAIEIDAPPLVGDDGNATTYEYQQAWVNDHLGAGVDRTTELGTTTRMNGTVPPGDRSPLVIELNDPLAHARVVLVPQHRRAWG